MAGVRPGVLEQDRLEVSHPARHVLLSSLPQHQADRGRVVGQPPEGDQTGPLHRVTGHAVVGEHREAEALGRIVTTDVHIATVTLPVAELVHQIADEGMHHIPVVDEK